MSWDGTINEHPIPIDGQLWFPGLWIPMRLAPVCRPYLDGLLADGQVVDIHFAQDLSGEEQPPFSGWFRPLESGHGYIQVHPKAWRPK